MGSSERTGTDMSRTLGLGAPELAAGLVLLWVRVYTTGLAQASRDRRLDQIRSDLWEHHTDRSEQGAGPAVIGLEALGRAVRGTTADLFWRFGLQGEPLMISKRALARAGGVSLLLVVGSIVGMMSSGFGIAGEDPYFTEDFPNFARSTSGHELGLIIASSFALVSMAAAVVLFQTFRAFQPWLAGIGAIALVVTSVCMIASVTAGFILIDLAEEWVAGGAIPGDGVWVSALHAAEVYEDFGIFAIGFLILGLSAFGSLIVWKAPLPRWSGSIGTLSGLILGTSLATSLIFGGDSYWYLLMLSAFLGLIWLVVTGAWLLMKGLYTGPAIIPPLEAVAR